jgi:hypothetical protein
VVKCIAFFALRQVGTITGQCIAKQFRIQISVKEGRICWFRKLFSFGMRRLSPGIPLFAVERKKGDQMNFHLKRPPVAVWLSAFVVFFTLSSTAQDSAHDDWDKVLIPYGETVYDVFNNVMWLADANLPAKVEPPNTNFRFGLPLCDLSNPLPADPCVNPSGSMNYTSAVAWVQGMNDANYLGHSDWQLPTTPYTDSSCSDRAKPGNNFGFGCDANALGYLYLALGFDAPNTAVPIPPNTVGPFSNFQPNLYWSSSPGGGPHGGLSVFPSSAGQWVAPSGVIFWMFCQ